MSAIMMMWLGPVAGAGGARKESSPDQPWLSLP
jgi:hypothetical protein